MKPKQFRAIREKLGLTQTELAELLGLSGRNPVTHYEMGVRNPSKLIVALMNIWDQLPEKKSQELRELLLEQMSLMNKPKRKKS